MPVISTRKRVTRAGRGAHAIYLPKAWLDAWGPTQAERAEIDLVSLDEHLVLSPVLPVEHPDAHLDTDDPADLARLLLSAYVSGHRAFTVRRSGGFTDDQLIEARRFLRLLDERLTVDWDDDRIRFVRDPTEETGRDVAAHLDLLCGKVLEAAWSLHELLEFFPHNPQRTLHAVHLVTAIERDDIQRIKNQAYRQVARLRIPARRVADLQLLMLGTHTLARMGKLLVETACTVGDHLGIPRDRLHYPPELLEKDLREVPAPGKVFRGFLDQARTDLTAYIALLEKTRGLCHPADDRTDGEGARDPSAGGSSSDPLDRLDGQTALQLSRDAQDAHDAVADHLMRRVQKAWGPEFVGEDPAAIYRVVKVHVHVQDLLQEVRTLADRIVDFRMAETMERHGPA